jgi:hypothetical protein
MTQNNNMAEDRSVTTNNSYQRSCTDDDDTPGSLRPPARVRNPRDHRQQRQALATMPNLEEEAPKRKAKRRKRRTRRTPAGTTTSSKPAATAFPGAIAVAGINSRTNGDERADDSKQSWRSLEERTRERVGAVASRGSDDVSREKEDRDRIQLGASGANNDGVARFPSAASSETDAASFSNYISAKELELGKHNSELHTFGSPIVAELALNEEDVEAKVSSRLQAEMEERLRREFTERLERERDMLVVAEAVEVRGVNEDDDDGDDKFCGLSRSRFFVVVAMILIVAVAGAVAGSVLGTREDIITKDPTAAPTIFTLTLEDTITKVPTAAPTAFAPTREDKITKVPTAAPTTFTTKSPTVAPTRYTTPEFDGLLKLIGPLVTDNIQTLQDPTTPQYLALDWLANVDGYKASDDFFITPEQVFIERYVLALLYFSTNGRFWTNQYNFILPRSICDWSDEGGNGVLCNESLYVEQLLIRKFLVTFNYLDRRWGRNLIVYCVLCHL